MKYLKTEEEIIVGDSVDITDIIVPSFRAIVAHIHQLTDKDVNKILGEAPINFKRDCASYYNEAPNREIVIVTFPDRVYNPDYAMQSDIVVFGDLMSKLPTEYKYFCTIARNLTLVNRLSLSNGTQEIEQHTL